MAEFCTLALTVMVCSLLLVVIFQAYGIPKLLERIAEALERIADALELKAEQDIRPEVYPDWYERLSELKYNYRPHNNGEAWYRADDVWDCIEKVVNINDK